MDKTIAQIMQMRVNRCVDVIKHVNHINSDAQTVDVYRAHSDVMEKMTVWITPMKSIAVSNLPTLNPQ